MLAASEEEAAASLLTATVFFTTLGGEGEAHPSRLSVEEESWNRVSFAPGAVLGNRYRIENVIHRDILGGVFRAFDLASGASVALKALAPHLSELGAAVFESLRKLEHPSILRVMDYGPLETGGLYVVMPLLQGIPLGKVLFARRAAPKALLLAFRRACEGVAHAHAHELVHCDLKPYNIHLEPDGRSIVLDWDLAQSGGRAPDATLGIRGTPLYMAPEQFDSGPATPQTDVYALGVTLYEILTGRHPSGPGESLAQTAYRARHERPPPPSALSPRVSRELDQLVLRCLEKDPRERFETARDLLSGLEDVDTGA